MWVRYCRMMITSCGCDIVAGETTDPTNSPWRAQGRVRRSDDGLDGRCSWRCSPCMCITEETKFRATIREAFFSLSALNSSHVLPSAPTSNGPYVPKKQAAKSSKVLLYQPHTIPHLSSTTNSIHLTTPPSPPPHHRLPADIWGSPSVSHGYLPGLTQMPRGWGHTRPIENAGDPCCRHLGRACAVV